MSDPTSPADPKAFLESIAHGYQDAIILLVANHLGVFGALAGQAPRSAAELAADLAVNARALDLLLCALAGADVLEQPEVGRFALRRDLVPYLDPEGDETLHSILDHHYHLMGRWSQLADVVRSGDPVARERRRSGRQLRSFICGMKDISRRSSEAVADAVPQLGECRRLLDLGGGPGTAAITFCLRWPDLHAVVFDLPEVVPITEREIETARLSSRITTRAGDYHEHDFLAAGAEPYDAVYVSNIIHSLDSEQTRALLSRAVAVLAPGGLLVVKDFYLDDSRTRPAFGARFAVNMLVGTPGGKTYTWREMEDLYEGLGMVKVRRVPVAVNSGMVVGRKAE